MKKHVITNKTPKNIPLGAGIFLKNMKFGQHYEKCLSSDENAIKIVESGATGSGDVDLEKVTPVEAGYIPTAGDYVKLVTGWYGKELGATSGGGKITITPEFLDLELDGKTVKVRGMDKKVAEVANMQINLGEYVKETLINALHLVEDTSDTTATGYTKFSSTNSLNDSDYLDNIGFVGFTAANKEIIFIMENAVCLSAFEYEGKNKEQGVFALTYDCTASIEQDDLEHLPYHLYYPTQAV